MRFAVNIATGEVREDLSFVGLTFDAAREPLHVGGVHHAVGFLATVKQEDLQHAVADLDECKVESRYFEIARKGYYYTLASVSLCGAGPWVYYRIAMLHGFKTIVMIPPFTRYIVNKTDLIKEPIDAFAKMLHTLCTETQRLNTAHKRMKKRKSKPTTVDQHGSGTSSP